MLTTSLQREEDMFEYCKSSVALQLSTLQAWHMQFQQFLYLKSV